MFKKQELEEIIDVFEKTNLNEFRIKEKDVELEMKKNCSDTDNSCVKDLKNNLNKVNNNTRSKQTLDDLGEDFHIVKSPIVGTFYSSSTPEEKNFIEIGDNVKDDTVVCMVEAMKLYNEVEAGVNGKIIEKIVENGEMVEYGQPLFKIEVVY